MTSYSGAIVKVAKPIDYQEGPWFYKRGPHYYMAYASSCCPEGIGYAMSDRATGPWVHKGPVMDPQCASTGNHPGIIDYKGHSYLFGFHYELNFAMTPIHHERRSVTLREFRYNPDGTIPRLPWWTDEGVAQIATLDPYRWVEAETIAWTSRIGRDATGPIAGRRASRPIAARMGGPCHPHRRRSFIKIGGVDFGTRCGQLRGQRGAGARSPDDHAPSRPGRRPADRYAGAERRRRRGLGDADHRRDRGERRA